MEILKFALIKKILDETINEKYPKVFSQKNRFILEFYYVLLEPEQLTNKLDNPNPRQCLDT